MKNSFTSGENRMLNGFAYRIQNSRIKREGSEFLLRRTFSRNFHVVFIHLLKGQIRYRFRRKAGRKSSGFQAGISYKIFTAIFIADFLREKSGADGFAEREFRFFT